MGYREPTPADLRTEAGRRAYSGMSHSPERRADSDIAWYVENVNSVWAQFQAVADTPEKMTAAEERAEQYRADMVKWQNIVWAAYSRCMSPMIVGPARFPVERNRKRMESYDRRCNEWQAWREKFVRRTLRDIQQIGAVRDPNIPANETVEVNGVQIVKNYDLDRVQIIFPGKPEREKIAALKGEAWNWSPRNSAWQRKLTDAAFRSAQRLAA